MTVAAIPIAAGQAGIGAGAGSEISLPSSGQPSRGRVAQSVGNPSGASAAADGTRIEQWQNLLRQAGLAQADSAADAQNPAGPDEVLSPSAIGPEATLLSIAHAQAQQQPLHGPEGAFNPAHAQTSSAAGAGENWATNSRHLSNTKTGGNSDAQKKGAGENSSAQTLLASLTMPAPATVPLPSVATSGSGAASGSGMSGSALGSSAQSGNETNALLSLAAHSGAAQSDTIPSGKSAASTQAQGLIAGQGISEQGIKRQGIAAESANLRGTADGKDGLTASGVLLTGADSKELKAAIAQAGNGPGSSNTQPHAEAALASGAQAALQNAQTSSDNPAHNLNASASAAAFHAAGSDSNGKFQKSPTNSQSASQARTSSSPLQTAATGATSAAQPPVSGQPQPVTAAGHLTLSGQDPRSNSTVGASPAPGAPSPDSRSANPFTSIDSGSSGNSSTNSAAWVHAGTHTAEAGFQDPSLGWVGVRAESVGGAIRAAVVPSSNDAALALGGHLAGLHAHLADQHELTGTVTLARPEASAGWSSGAHNPGHGNEQGSSPGGGAPMYSGSFAGNGAGNSAGNGGGNSGSHQQSAGAGVDGTAGVSSGSLEHAADHATTTTHISSRGGGLISVMA